MERTLSNVPIITMRGLDGLTGIMEHARNRVEFFRTSFGIEEISSKFGIEEIPSKPTADRILGMLDGNAAAKAIIKTIKKERT